MQQKIIAHIMAAKAGKTDGLKNTIRIKSVSLGLDSNDAAIEKCIIYCEKNGILRREGDKVLYPPFTDAITHPVKNELEEKAKLFFSKFRQNKPTKRASLVTVCQNLLKLDNAQTEAMIHYLVAQKKTPHQRNRRAHLAPITNQAGTLRCVSLSTESLIRPSDAPCLKLSGERLYF